jgi:Cu2+-containing amine oxidase
VAWSDPHAGQGARAAVAGARAPVTLGEYAECERLVRADQRFREGLRRRGINHPDQVVVEAWGIGTFTGDQDAGRRLVWTLCFYRAEPGGNPYAKPIHGLHAVVDLDDMAVVRVEDAGVVPLPPGSGDYVAASVAPRAGLKPIEIRQPAGVSFQVDGWEVRWQHWHFRLGFNAREGLVLHTIGYEEAQRLRPVVHRASVAELVIPYADPRPFQGWRNAFDIGEYGIGILTNSLELAPKTLAAHHQHFFSVRLDMAVDGDRNSVYEVEAEAVPAGPDNPYGNAFRTRQTLLRTESQAQRLIDPLTARHWLVVNPGVTNALGQPVGYKLVPHGNVLPFAHEGASVTRRAAFMTRHLWVTRFAPDERFPAGDYPNQHPGGAGLPEWTKADRAIENTDIVLWYTLGSHHIPRPEDWPVMPVERAGFALKPVGFFNVNPALDIPPSHGGQTAETSAGRPGH